MFKTIEEISRCPGDEGWGEIDLHTLFQAVNQFVGHTVVPHMQEVEELLCAVLLCL